MAQPHNLRLLCLVVATALSGCTPGPEAPVHQDEAPATQPTEPAPTKVKGLHWDRPPEPPPRQPHPEVPAAGAKGSDWGDSGAEGCGQCHAAEATAWSGSHHDLADTPSDLVVDGPRFDGKPVKAGMVTVTPRKVTTALQMRVADGSGSRDYRVVAKIGVAPLQQYLLDGGAGRLLVAPIAWNVEKTGWFDPSTDGATGDPKDPFYWGGLTGTWNHMCADCHTTSYDEGYSPTDQTYTSTWRSPDVGCASCHGPTAEVEVRTQSGQMATCGFCHSRREPLGHGHTPGAPTYDEIVPTLLDGPVYGADGSIRAPEESFEYGSFAQSRMYEAGVTCTDCHDPHSGRLRAEGPKLCESCHESSMFTTTTHTGHTAAGGPTCVDCHMGTATYMGIHVRHDHYFRVPDPQTLTAASRPGPCAACHADGRLPTASAAPTRQTVLGREFTGLVAAARRAGGTPSMPPPPGTLDQLAHAAMNPGVGELRRASAVALVARIGGAAGNPLYRTLLADPLPALRRAAVEALAGLPEGGAALDVSLVDRSRAVRFAAIRGAPPASTGPWAAVFEEVRAASIRSDVGADHTNLGVLLGMGGRTSEAEAELRTAVRIDPAFLPARQNLAVLLAQTGRRPEAERLLEAGK